MKKNTQRAVINTIVTGLFAVVAKTTVTTKGGKEGKRSEEQNLKDRLNASWARSRGLADKKYKEPTKEEKKAEAKTPKSDRMKRIDRESYARAALAAWIEAGSKKEVKVVRENFNRLIGEVATNRDLITEVSVERYLAGRIRELVKAKKGAKAKVSSATDESEIGTVTMPIEMPTGDPYQHEKDVVAAKLNELGDYYEQAGVCTKEWLVWYATELGLVGDDVNIESMLGIFNALQKPLGIELVKKQVDIFVNNDINKRQNAIVQTIEGLDYGASAKNDAVRGGLVARMSEFVNLPTKDYLDAVKATAVTLADDYDAANEAAAVPPAAVVEGEDSQQEAPAPTPRRGIRRNDK